MALLLNLLLILSLTATIVNASTKGIYLTQYTLENTAFLNYLIEHAKKSGITTFVVDMEKPSKRYRDNIALVKQNNIEYVARITMFPDGGTAKQINDRAYWERKYALAKQAVDWGASQIQLDYIRFKASQKASPENAKQILAIIEWFKTKLAAQNIPLQIDVFGIAAFGESKHIGQNIKMFAPSIDAVCPMVYPSHYTPFAYHFKRPYETILESLEHIQGQFDDKMPIKMIPYIELSNYHYSMSREATLKYINAQIDAVEEADADGWYAWSPHNRYDNLFTVLESRKNKPVVVGAPVEKAEKTETSKPVASSQPIVKDNDKTDDDSIETAADNDATAATQSKS
jgi:hypothetical protein